jgi:hypothetical protein
MLKDGGEEFNRIYNECLLLASQLRKEKGTFLYGENIDSPNLLEHYKGRITIAHQYTIKLHTDPTFPDVLHPDLRSEFYTRTYVDYASLDGVILKQMPFNSYLLVSRHGQSLCVVRIHSGIYLILDSHLHTCWLASAEDAYKHIMMDNGGHTHLTILFGV